MTAYKTGRSTDYQGSETPSKRYAVRPYENTTDIVTGIEHSRILRSETWILAHTGKQVKG